MAPPVLAPAPSPAGNGDGNANAVAGNGGVPAVGKPAGYGRSCTNCSRAKCKCILRPDGRKCERCHRLGKECYQMATMRKRVAKKSTSSRTAQLEEKLDDLVSILRASQQPGQSGSSPVLPGLTAAAFTSRLDSLATAATAAPPHPPAMTDAAAPSPSTSRSAVAHGESDCYPEPTMEEAEACLVQFRHWLPNLPVLYLPPDLTARKLRQEKPFLWLCIMNLTSMSARQQRMLRARVRREVAERVMINLERDVDILQGLMVYLAWATVNTSPASKPFLVSYAQLAAAVYYDLSWSWTPAEESRFNQHFRILKPTGYTPRVCTMEERRAVVGLWFLISGYAGLLGKIEPLRWSTHMQECLNFLEQHPEHPQDEVLVSLVKVQLIGNEAYQLLFRDVIEMDSSRAPAFVFRKGLLDRLNALRISLPLRLSTHAYLQAHIVTTESAIHIPAVLRKDERDDGRLESLYMFLKTQRAWFDVFFSLPPSDMPGLPFSFFIDLFKAQLGLCKLTTLEDLDWDKKIIQNMAHPVAVIDQVIEKMEQVIQVYPVQADDEDDPLFVRACRMLRTIKTTWEPTLNQHFGGLPTPSSQPITATDIYPGHMQQPANHMVPEASADFQDSMWISEILGPWEF